MRRMNGKRAFLALILCLLMAIPMQASAAMSFVMLKTGTVGYVEEVVDGDSLRIRTNGGQHALVKLIGVDTMGEMAAYEYMLAAAQGMELQFVLDPSVPGNGRWNFCYVYNANELLNGTLLQNGLGKVNEAHKDASLYKSLVSRQSIARTARIGIWADPNYPGGLIYTGVLVNINTATASQLAANLENVSAALANAIVSYRARHPFRSIADIKFVPNMTKTIFDLNRHKLTVITNVQTASEEELRMLTNLTSEEVRRIIEHRMRYGISNLRDLVTYSCISQAKYDVILPFISREDVLVYKTTVPNYTVNVNTATRTHLGYAGLNSAQVSRVLAMRDKKYTFKSLYELASAGGLALNEANINLLADNLHVMTEVNNASAIELRTLFGSASYAVSRGDALAAKQPFKTLTEVSALLSAAEYAAISPYIYLDSYAGNYVNANTATVDQLELNGIPRQVAVRLNAQAGKMTNPDLIPAEALAYEKSFSLYTNINTASVKELTSLHPDMSLELVNAILVYRADQPFGSQKEIEEFFKDWKQTAIYTKCKGFIVTR